MEEMKAETVLVKKSDLEELKACFEYLRKENEELKAKAEVEPEDIGLDLSGFKEFIQKEEPPTDEEILASVGEVENYDDEVVGIGVLDNNIK